MLRIGEKYVYGTSGVVELVDIRTECALGETKDYYVFKSPGASCSLTYIPLDNKKLISQIRPLISKDEIYLIIRDAKNSAEHEWIEDNRKRNEKFREIISGGDRTEIVRMLRSIYIEQSHRSNEGKKYFISDENAMRKAERIIYTEFSQVLGMPVEHVHDYLLDFE
jgi:CarD family transcriptional regulator